MSGRALRGAFVIYADTVELVTREVEVRRRQGGLSAATAGLHASSTSGAAQSRSFPMRAGDDAGGHVAGGNRSDGPGASGAARTMRVVDVRSCRGFDRGEGAWFGGQELQEIAGRHSPRNHASGSSAEAVKQAAPAALTPRAPTGDTVVVGGQRLAPAGHARVANCSRSHSRTRRGGLGPAHRPTRRQLHHQHQSAEYHTNVNMSV